MVDFNKFNTLDIEIQNQIKTIYNVYKQLHKESDSYGVSAKKLMVSMVLTIVENNKDNMFENNNIDLKEIEEFNNSNVNLDYNSKIENEDDFIMFLEEDVQMNDTFDFEETNNIYDFIFKVFSCIEVGVYFPCDKSEGLNNIMSECYDKCNEEYELENNSYVINMHDLFNQMQDLKNQNNMASKTKTLKEIGVDLTDKTYNNNPALGREDIIKKIAITLTTPSKSALLIGNPGIGKTAVIEGLAYEIQNKKYLQNKKIIEISASSFISGQSLLGEFENNVESIINELKQDENIILYIDEIHQIFDMGSSSSNVMNMLKKPLSEGKIKLIGTTTKEDYDETLRYDSSFVDRFDVFQINELDKKNIIRIINDKIKYLEEYFDIKMPFDQNNLNIFINYLILITDKNNRNLNQACYNPRLVLQILETIFATAKVNDHKIIEQEDIIYGINSTTKIRRNTYRIPNLFNNVKKTEKNKVIDINKVKVLKKI